MKTRICIALLLIPICGESGHAAPTVSDRIVQRFMTLDEDSSGTVTLDEYMGMVADRAEQRFNAMDRNHDGAVDEHERALYWRKQQAKWYRLNR
ncbi:MAG: thymidylate synthase [Mariprofundales bacterium]|nr:thymidylate synthase [Mariprofundales bacterium]